MYLEFHMDSEDLNEKFLDSLRALFKGKKISIYVEQDMDETDYLLSTKANKERLEQSIKEIEEGKTVEVSLDEIIGDNED